MLKSVLLYTISWFILNYRLKARNIAQIDGTREQRNCRLLIAYTFPLFRVSVLDLRVNLRQFSLFSSCVITIVLVSDSVIWLFLFNQPSPHPPPELPESLWFGLSAPTPRQANPDAIIESYANRKPQDAPVSFRLTPGSLSANDIITLSVHDYYSADYPEH